MEDEGVSKDYVSENPLDLEISNEELITTRDMLITINHNKYDKKHNIINEKIISSNNCFEYDEDDASYKIDEVSLKLHIFEKRFDNYGTQYPIMVNQMKRYGYEIFTEYHDEVLSEEETLKLKEFISNIKHQAKNEETIKTFELLDHLTENNIEIYKEIRRGNINIFKSPQYEQFRIDNDIYAKEITIIEKNIKYIWGLYKFYDIETIKEIYKACINTKTGNIAWADLDKQLAFAKLNEKRKQGRIDIPILKIMQNVEKWIKENPNRSVQEIKDWIDDITCKYANNIPGLVVTDINYLKKLKTYITELFNLIVDKGNSKNYIYKLKLFTPLWTKKSEFDLVNTYVDKNTREFFATQLLENTKENENDIKEVELPDFEKKDKVKEEDVKEEINTMIMQNVYDFVKFANNNNINNRFIRKHENKDRSSYYINSPQQEISKILDSEETRNLFSDII